MKIMFVCSSFGGGGAEKVAVKLSSALAELGNDVIYVYWSSKYGQQYTINEKVACKKIPHGISLIRAGLISNIIRKERPHVVFSFTDMPNIVAFFACLMAWPTKCLRVPNVRTDVAEKYRGSGKKLFFNLLSFLHGLSCKSAPLIFVNSKGSGKSLCEYYQINESKVHCIYNPVFDTPTSLLSSAASHINNRTQRIKAVSVGRLTKEKDHQMLIRAVDYTIRELGVDVELDIFGEGELRDQLQSNIIQYGLSERVFLKSFDPNIEKKLKKYHLFLFSSRREGLPNALIEALGSGLAVISTDCPSGPREILDNGRFGTLVEIGNYQKMAESIANLYFDGDTIVNDNLTCNVSRGELSRHLARFSIPCVTSQYLNLITRKLSEH